MKTKDGKSTINKILKHTYMYNSSSSSVYTIITRKRKNPIKSLHLQETKEVQALGCNNGRDVLGLGASLQIL
jgi:hypothetical protein